jgi:hypothetical protein
VDCRSHTEAWTEATLGIAVDFFIDHRGRGVMADIRDDGDIWLDAMSDHLCTSEADFFLDAVDEIDSYI